MNFELPISSETEETETAIASKFSSQKSKTVSDLDEHDQIIETRPSKKDLQIEMVNLKEPREIIQEGKVN